jgi:NAD(P)-dependent dehydrogenase (short-subunit alcohol dehydrogenase family)
LAELDGQTALVTGGGRGIGANIARELKRAGMDVAVAARTVEEVSAVGEKVGTWVVADVSREPDVQRMLAEVEVELGPVDVLVNNAGIEGPEEPFEAHTQEDWWRTFEVNVLGVYLCCRGVVPRMLKRGGGRVVNVTSGAAYLPTVRPGASTAYGTSKAAVHRYSELLAKQLTPQGVFVFSISPGLVRTAMTEGNFPDDAPWTPPECAPRLVRKLASGRYDALAGRYLHAEHDDLDELMARIDEVREQDLNAVRLRR